MNAPVTQAVGEVLGVPPPFSPRLALFGVFGVGNLGNDATLEAMLHQIRVRSPNDNVLCIAPAHPPLPAWTRVEWRPVDPAPPRGLWRVRPRPLREAYALLATLACRAARRRAAAQELRGAGALLIVGTGVLDDFGARAWDLPTWLRAWCDGAGLAGIPVHLVAVGAGPIRRPLNRMLMLQATRSARTRSFRDRDSAQFLARHGIETRRDPVVPDLVFGLPPEILPPVAPVRDPVRTVGLGVMGYFGWSADERSGGDTYRRYLGRLAVFARWLLGRGLRLRLLIGETGTDDRAVRDLLALLAGEPGVGDATRVEAPPIRTPSELLEVIAGTDIVIASRYHNVIGALLLERPVIALGYSGKFEALMSDVGLESYCQFVESLDVALLQDQFVRLCDEAGPATDRMRSRTREYRERLHVYFDALFAELHAPVTEPRSLTRTASS